MTLLSMVSVGWTSGAVFTWGDGGGQTVEFVEIAEETDAGGGPLFGEPFFSGNSIDFNPRTFVASSTGGGISMTGATLSFTIVARPGNGIGGVILTEAGDVTLFGIGGAGTRAEIQAEISAEVLEIDGETIDPIGFDGSLEFTPSGGSYSLADDGVLVGTIWEGQWELDLDEALVEAGESFTFGATRVRITLTNLLNAESEGGTQAFVQKKDVGGVGLTVFPEPSAALLLLLSGIASLRRSRSTL